MARRSKRPIGQTLGGVLFGFEQQVLRHQPPADELVHHARPDGPVATGDGTKVTITLPPPVPDPAPGSARAEPGHGTMGRV